MVENVGTKRIGPHKKSRNRKKPKTGAAIIMAALKKAQLRREAEMQGDEEKAPTSSTFYVYGAKLKDADVDGGTVYWPPLDFNLRRDYLLPDGKFSVVYNGKRRFQDRNDAVQFLCLSLLLRGKEYFPPGTLGWQLLEMPPGDCLCCDVLWHDGDKTKENGIIDSIKVMRRRDVISKRIDHEFLVALRYSRGGTAYYLADNIG